MTDFAVKKMKKECKTTAREQTNFVSRKKGARIQMKIIPNGENIIQT